MSDKRKRYKSVDIMVKDMSTKKFYKKYKADKRKKKKCTCKIRGIVELFIVENGFLLNIHPSDYTKNLRKFKYCPICGKSLKEKP